MNEPEQGWQPWVAPPGLHKLDTNPELQARVHGLLGAIEDAPSAGLSNAVAVDEADGQASGAL